MSELQQHDSGEPTERNEDEHLQFTQNIRHKLIDKVTDGGTKMPEDVKEQYLLATVLNDMDRQALGIKKIGAKEKNNTADRVAALAIAQVLGRFQDGSPFERPIINGESRHVSPPSVEGQNLPAITLAPGETEIGIATRNFDQFMDDMENRQK